MKKYFLLLLVILGVACNCYSGESYGYNEVGLPKWQCLNCGRRMQAYSPPLYGCPRGQYNRHAWIQYR